MIDLSKLLRLADVAISASYDDMVIGSPTITSLLDSNGYTILLLSPGASPTNYWFINNSTGNPVLSVIGTSSNISPTLRPRGTGKIIVQNGSDTTKAISFDTSAVSTGTTRNVAFSDASGTLALTSDITTAINALIAAAPGALDTLDELAAALGDDANFAATITTALGLKAPLASPTFTGTVAGITAAMVGLGSVDNTADTAKPVSTAQQTALNLKADLISPTFTGTPTLPTPVINGTPTGTGVATAATASTLALRDSSANLTADNFLVNRGSTVTSAGTLTMTIDSAAVQVFTGSTTHTVLLPTTGVLAGQPWTIVNQSTGSITVQSSAASGIANVLASKTLTLTAKIDSPTAAADWDFYYPGGSTSAVAASTVLRDGNANITSDNMIYTATSTATAAGTTALTINSARTQVFTGSTTQTVTLPTTSVVAGQDYLIVNNSSGTVTVQSSGANTVDTVAGGAMKRFTSQVATPTTAANWKAWT